MPILLFGLYTPVQFSVFTHPAVRRSAKEGAAEGPGDAGGGGGGGEATWIKYLHDRAAEHPPLQGGGSVSNRALELTYAEIKQHQHQPSGAPAVKIETVDLTEHAAGTSTSHQDTLPRRHKPG